MGKKTRSRTSILQSGSLILLLCAFFCSNGSAAPATDAPIRESWDVVSLFGVPVGYTHTITRKVAVPEPEIETTTLSETRVKYLGTTLITHETEKDYETPAGALVRVTYSVSGAETGESEAVVRDGKLIVTAHTGGTTHVSESAWDPEVIGPEAQIRKMRESGFPVGKPIRYKEYLRDINKVATDTITIEGRETLTIAGRRRELYKGTETEDALPGMEGQIWLDETGDEVKCVVNDGTSAVDVTRDEALRAVTSPDEPDLATVYKIASNVEFGHPERVKEALYRIEGSVENLKLEDRRQNIESQGPGWVLLRVKALGDAAKPSPEKPGPKYLAASAYLQSDDPDIRRMALDHVSPSASPAANARRLADWVSRYITKKDYNVGFASAKETLLSREGDCTEHAMLLAALLRAAGIPSRVAVGVTYADGQFMGHMWTEAYLNDWTALDATLSDGRVVDATHIKLAVSAMDSPTGDDIALTLEAQAVTNLKISVQKFEEGILPELGGGLRKMRTRRGVSW